jgi:hypothetical protein
MRNITCCRATSSSVSSSFCPRSFRTCRHFQLCLNLVRLALGGGTGTERARGAYSEGAREGDSPPDGEAGAGVTEVDAEAEPAAVPERVASTPPRVRQERGRELAGALGPAGCGRRPDSSSSSSTARGREGGDGRARAGPHERRRLHCHRVCHGEAIRWSLRLIVRCIGLDRGRSYGPYSAVIAHSFFFSFNQAHPISNGHID